MARASPEKIPNRLPVIMIKIFHFLVVRYMKYRFHVAFSTLTIFYIVLIYRYLYYKELNETYIMAILIISLQYEVLIYFGIVLLGGILIEYHIFNSLISFKTMGTSFSLSWLLLLSYIYITSWLDRRS